MKPKDRVIHSEGKEGKIWSWMVEQQSHRYEEELNTTAKPGADAFEEEMKSITSHPKAFKWSEAI